MSQLRKLIEVRRHSRSWENEARDAQGRWTNQGNDGKAIAQEGLQNLIKRTKIRQALRQDAADKVLDKDADIPIKIVVPNGRKILGDPNISENELKTIGIKEFKGKQAKLTEKQLDDLHFVRNGAHNLGEFLNSPPNFHDNSTVGIYAGNRVKMYITDGGNVEFTVDNTYKANETKGNPPSQELRDMTRAWLQYTKSQAGDRVFWNTPAHEKEGTSRYDARVRTYQKYGFISPKLDNPGKSLMLLDNRRNKNEKLNYQTTRILEDYSEVNEINYFKALGINPYRKED